MKMIKSMKRLKFWSKKKSYTSITESPPPPYYSHYRQYDPVLPSAPPLPPWLDYDQQQQQLEETFLTTEIDSACDSSESKRSEAHLCEEEINNSAYESSESRRNEAHLWEEEISAPEVSTEERTSYQQLMVKNSVYATTPVVAESKKLERPAGVFGCFINLGFHFVRRVFPCFHIREEAHYHKIE